MFKVRNTASSRSDSESLPLRLTKLDSIETSKTDGRQIMDMSFFRTHDLTYENSMLSLVNDQGTVFICNFQEGGKVMSV